MTRSARILPFALLLAAGACRNDRASEPKLERRAEVANPAALVAASAAARIEPRQPRLVKQSRSIDHLPRACRFAMRVNWRDAQRSDAASKYRQVLEERFSTLFPGADGSPLKYFAKLGIDPENDIQDIGICALVGPTPDSLDTLVIIAGSLPDGVLSPDVLGVGQPVLDVGGVRAVRLGGHGWLAQANDDALVFATARTVIEAALFSGAYDYGLDPSAALAVELDGQLLRGMLSKLGEAEEIQAIKTATVHVERDFDSLFLRAHTESEPNAQRLATWLKHALTTPDRGCSEASDVPFRVGVDRREVWLEGSLSSKCLTPASIQRAGARG